MCLREREKWGGGGTANRQTDEEKGKIVKHTDKEKTFTEMSALFQIIRKKLFCFRNKRFLQQNRQEPRWSDFRYRTDESTASAWNEPDKKGSPQNDQRS